MSSAIVSVHAAIIDLFWYECQDAAELPDCRRPIKRGQSLRRDLPLGADMSGPEQILGSTAVAQR